MAKLDLGPRSLNEIRDESIISSFWEPASDREHRKQVLPRKDDDDSSGELDGVVWSLVSINRAANAYLAAAVGKTDGICLHRNRGKTAMPSHTVQAIPAILAGYEDELTPGSITVMDTRGNKYLESGNIAVGVDSHNRAREEELVGKIIENLEWIKGSSSAGQGARSADR